MSVVAFERDNGVAEPAFVEDAGLVAGSIDIVVNGVVFGTIHPEKLKVQAQRDLESLQSVTDMLRWLTTHAGVNDQMRVEIEREFNEMPIRAVFELAQSIAHAVAQVVRVPKAKRPR